MENRIPHPGVRIRAEVIPQGMSVTKAAELLDVGRPALSNLLNGNASLSAEMATRLEQTFKKFSREELLEMQAEYDAAQSQKNVALDIKAYVPPYLGIKANQIEQWVERNIIARSRLAVLLRTLVHSAGHGLSKVDFPGNDDSERAGWDGFVEASESTPWIPSGKSGWEFGTTDKVEAKANADYKKSVAQYDESGNASERQEITFVFVTPRHWPGKQAWITKAKAKNEWKDVRAYDSSDLEQWLAQSIPGQAWFANEAQIPASNVRSLDKCWTDWASVTSPNLTADFFQPAIEANRETIAKLLANSPSESIVIAADSTEEALAFLAQAFSDHGDNELSLHRDRILIFDKPGIVSKLAAGAQTFIPVAHSREVEREFAPYLKSMHTIVIYPRNAANIEKHIDLEPVDYKTFETSLEKMGKNRDEISHLTDESGRSLTVLRRRLASGALRTPTWADEPNIAASLVPFMLIGAWRWDNSTDQSGLSLIAGGRASAELEQQLQKLLSLNDPPVWSIGNYRGVISKIDLLFSIANTVTSDDLERYFQMAEMVLGEDDPKLDLPADKRWAAGIYGKAREFSGAFRKGISETLVLLAVYGNKLFKQRLGFDAEERAARIVQTLLSPLTTRKLAANDRDLPTYAEAAPETFLGILEADLKTDDPAVMGLMQPASGGILGGDHSRSGILWALEGLSWNPQTLSRAVAILAQLATVEINDNWTNKPANSLETIFRAWMPQTAADLDTRVGVIKWLAEKYPNVAWNLCARQFGDNFSVGHYSHKPQWRSDGYGFGQPITDPDVVYRFRVEMIELAISWKPHTVRTLSDLISHLRFIPPEFQTRIWRLVTNWALNTADDDGKAKIREKIRTSVFTRRAKRQSKSYPNEAAFLEAANDAYAAIQPLDVLNRHAWLFATEWLEESADEIEDAEKIDFQKRHERILDQRAIAIEEINRELGFAGIIELARRGKTAGTIGHTIVLKNLLTSSDLIKFLKSIFDYVQAESIENQITKLIIAGALRAIKEPEERASIISAVTGLMSDESKASFLTLAPYGLSTWSIVDRLDEVAQDKYWNEVVPEYLFDSDTQNSESVQRLLKAKRPRAAFACIHFKPECVDPVILYRLLNDLTVQGADKTGEYPLDRYDVEQSFKHIDKNTDISLEDKARLEFAYIDVLAVFFQGKDDHYGIPNLERLIEKHPIFFVQALCWSFRRKDGKTDPEELKAPTEKADDLANRGFSLLEGLKRIPGSDEFGAVDEDKLLSWIEIVRELANEYGRKAIADNFIGKLLSHSPVGDDGVWPCEPVRKVMESIRSDDLMDGAQVGVINSRGVHWRGEGGDQERVLADKYLNWANALMVKYPYVSSALLMKLGKSYQSDASYQDIRASINRRTRG